MAALPLTIDPFALAKQQAHFKGEIPLSRFARLKELLVNTEGEARIELNFSHDDLGKVCIEGKIAAVVRLVCQRCGEPLSYDINVEPKISPVLSDAEAALVQKKYDTWVTNSRLIQVLELIEEEILLSLPMIAKHQQGSCPVEVSQVFS